MTKCVNNLDRLVKEKEGFLNWFPGTISNQNLFRIVA